MEDVQHFTSASWIADLDPTWQGKQSFLHFLRNLPLSNTAVASKRAAPSEHIPDSKSYWKSL